MTETTRRLTTDEQRELHKWGAFSRMMERRAARFHGRLQQAWLAETTLGHATEQYTVVGREYGSVLVKLTADGSRRTLWAPVPLA